MGRVLISAREFAQPIVKLYTLGYQGTDVTTYVGTLKAAGVGVVVDVRETAWSYKRGFCKSALTAELSKAGIEYVHLRSAGNPKANRRTAKTNKECLQRYRKHLKQNPGGLQDLLIVLKSLKKRGKSACLTCFEREANECHRSILTSAIEAHKGGFTPVHLIA
jgi:uncharacterized protein (DUF488 family)